LPNSALAWLAGHISLTPTSWASLAVQPAEGSPVEPERLRRLV